MHEEVLIFHNLEKIILKNHCFRISLHNPKVYYLPLKHRCPFQVNHLLSEKEKEVL